MSRKQLGLIGLLQLVSFFAQADSLFDQIDRDHDQSISTREAQLIPELAGKMTELDLDYNNRLNRHEFEQFRPLNQAVSWVWQPESVELSVNRP